MKKARIDRLRQRGEKRRGEAEAVHAEAHPDPVTHESTSGEEETAMKHDQPSPEEFRAALAAERRTLEGRPRDPQGQEYVVGMALLGWLNGAPELTRTKNARALDRAARSHPYPADVAVGNRRMVIRQLPDGAWDKTFSD